MQYLELGSANAPATHGLIQLVVALSANSPGSHDYGPTQLPVEFA
jgi:hypothetical protein